MLGYVSILVSLVEYMYLAKNLTHSFDKAKQEDLLDTCIITGTMLLKVTVFLVNVVHVPGQFFFH